jgi:hypothetical protein
MSSEFGALRELARIVNKQFPKREQLAHPQKNDLHSRLYSGLLDDGIGDEEALVKRLGVDEKERSNFHVLRNQLKEKLFNMLFMLDLSEGGSSEYRRAIFENARLVFLSQVLTIFGLPSLAVRVARSGLKQAQKYELTPNALHFLRLLKARAAFLGQGDAYDELSNEKREMLKIYLGELDARELTERLSVRLSVTGTRSDSLAKEALATSHELAKIFEQYHTFNIGLEFYRASTIGLELNEDFAKAEAFCSNAKTFLDGFPQFKSSTLYGEFALRKLECALHVGDYIGANEAALDCKKHYASRDTNWFFYMEYEFRLRMHELKFEAAATVLREVTSQPRFEALTEMRQKRWALFEFYLEYVEGKFKNADFAARRLDSLDRYRLTTTAYTKDKSGYNPAIMVIEYLILLDSKKYDVLGDKIDALRVYRQRYLKKSPATNGFIGFLIQLARNLENPEAMKKMLAKQQEEAKASKKDTSDPLESIQVLPYPWLRKHILESLVKT